MQKILLICLITCITSVRAQIIDINTCHLEGDTTIYRGYRKSFFPIFPTNQHNLGFRVRNGNLQSSSNGKDWIPSSSFSLPRGTSGDWDEFDFLGATALVSDPVNIPLTLDGDDYKWDILALGKNRVIEIGSTNEIFKFGQTIYKISLFQSDISATKRSLFATFKVNSAPFAAFRLASATFLSDNILLIIACTEDSDVNYAVFYNLAKKKPVSYEAFSSIQYLPHENAINFGAGTPNCFFHMPGFDESKIEVKKIHIFNGKKLSPELRTDNALFNLKQK